MIFQALLYIFFFYIFKKMNFMYQGPFGLHVESQKNFYEAPIGY